MKIFLAVLGILAFSGIASAQCTPPAFLPSEHGASMCWGASPSPGITGYNVFRAESACSATPLAWVKLAALSATVLAYKDLTAKPGVTYCYTFTAVSANGQSDQAMGAKLELTPPRIIAAPPFIYPPGTASGVGS